MKLNFSLDKLELALDDTLLIEAENLLSVGKYALPVEIEKNLYLTRFTEGLTPVDTEIQLVGTKVKAVSCECDDFRTAGICPHIGATLLTLNERKKKEKEGRRSAPSAKTVATDTPQKLTIPNILKRIEAVQLIEFIADYARTDKQFALALKTRFAGDMSFGDAEMYYRTLIDNTLRSVKNTKGRITPKGWLQVFTMLDELRQKSESHFKTGELNASFELLRISMPLIHRFLRFTDAPKVKLEKRQVQFSEILRGFSELLVSPELSEKLWEFMLGEFGQNVRFEFSARLFDWLLKNADTVARVERLLGSLDNQLVINRSFVESRERLTTQKVSLLQKSGRVDLASQLILSASAAQPDVLFFAIENALLSDDLPLAKSLCENGLHIFRISPPSTDRLEQYMLDIAERAEDTEGVLRFAELRFLRTLKMEFYDKLKTYGIAAPKLAALIQIVENQSYRLEKRDTLAAIYIAERQFEKLKNWIVELQSLELLRRYGYELWRHDAPSAVDLCRKIIDEYLMTHLGRPPAQRIRTVLEGHILYGGWDLAVQLTNELKKAFPERHSLKEELDDLIFDWERKGGRLLIKN